MTTALEVSKGIYKDKSNTTYTLSMATWFTVAVPSKMWFYLV